MKIKEIHYGKYGRCLEISNNIIELVATLDIGPRIIRFATVNGPNEFGELNFTKNEPTHDDFKAFGDFGNWNTYGGHRLWASPESHPRTYIPDNMPINHRIIGNKLILTGHLQQWTGQIFEMEIEMSETEPIVYVNHIIKNMNPWPVELAPWAISVMAPGGFEIIPWPTKNTGLLNNRLLSIWPYTKMNDERVNFGENFITLRQDINSTCPFKIGLNNEHGYSAYFNHGNMFIKYFKPVEGAVYPDGGMTFETYTNNKILEIESLGALVKLNYGESTSHQETWKLVKNITPPALNSEIEYEEVIKRYL